MKTKLFLTAGLLLLVSNLLFAQGTTRFVKSGTIEYDKNVNTYALITREMALNGNNDAFGPKAFEAYKKNHPQIQVLKSALVFGDDKTLFTPGIPPDEAPNYFFDMPMAHQFNTIYTDLTTSTRISQKTVFDDKLLIKDSTIKIKWKITDETRDILGYTCRRANGIIQDSIYVVAFYTDQIAVTGGPESFAGLPGMILQVALPHENVSWLATKVTDSTIPATTLVPPKKGKPVTGKEFQATLKGAMKQWGIYGEAYVKALQL